MTEKTILFASLILPFSFMNVAETDSDYKETKIAQKIEQFKQKALKDDNESIKIQT